MFNDCGVRTDLLSWNGFNRIESTARVGIVLCLDNTQGPCYNTRVGSLSTVVVLSADEQTTKWNILDGNPILSLIRIHKNSNFRLSVRNNAASERITTVSARIKYSRNKDT